MRRSLHVQKWISMSSRDTMAKPASGYRRSMLKPSLSRYQLAAAPTVRGRQFGANFVEAGHGRLLGRPGRAAFPFHPGAPHVVPEPHPIGPGFGPPPPHTPPPPPAPPATHHHPPPHH